MATDESRQRGQFREMSFFNRDGRKSGSSEMKKPCRIAMAASAMILAMGSAQAADTLLLGLSMAKTGPYVSLANTNEIAADIAVSEINASGGVNGKKIALSKFDTGGDPKQAALAVRHFVDEKALAIAGPFSSSEVKVSFPVGDRSGIAQMAMSSSAPGLGRGFKFAFRNTTDEGRVVDEVLGALKDKHLPMGTGAIAYATDDTVSKSLGTAVFPAVFKQFGVPVKETVDFQYKAFDLSSQVSRIASAKPDVVGLGTPPEAAINLAKELKRQGVSTRLLGGTTIADPDLPQRMGGAGENMTIGTTFFADYNAASKKFAAEFAKRAKAAGLSRTAPNQMDAATYDIVYLYAEAMKNARVSGDADKLEEERTKIRDALIVLKNFNALEGPIHFDRDHDAVKPIYVLENKQGRWSLLDRRIPKE